MYRALLTAAVFVGLSSSAMAQSHELVRLVGRLNGTKKEQTVKKSFRGVALLQGFKFEFAFADHHIARLGILHDPGSVTAAYTDKNGDDWFAWSADFVSLQHPSIVLGEAVGTQETGRAVKLLKEPRGDFVFVLRGFELSYGFGDREDHHVDQIGVFEQSGQLHVMLNDKNNDDIFKYRVQYAYVPKSVFRRTLSISDTSKGEQIARTTSGTPVICGFLFDFKSKDHHLRGIGVDSNDGNVQVSYFDKNRDDAYRWNVKLAVLSDAPAEPVVRRPTRNVLKATKGLKLKLARPARR